MHLDEQRVQTTSVSEDDIAEKAPAALAYLKRTNNMDAVEALGLSTYLKESDEQATEDSTGSGSRRDERCDSISATSDGREGVAEAG